MNAEFDGFLFQLDAEALADSAADEVAQSFEIGGASAIAGDQSEAVAGGDADQTECKTFAEAGPLQQPGGRELVAVLAGCPVGYGVDGQR